MSVSDNYQNSYGDPEAGNRYIALDIAIENISAEPQRYNNPWVRLKDDQSYVYSHTSTDIDPYLTTGTIPPGEKVRGWMTFEIPAAAVAVALLFEPLLGTPIEVPLTP